MTDPDGGGSPRQEDPPVRELNVFSIDKVVDDDDLYDFRAVILPSDAEEEEVEVPKASYATEPAVGSTDGEVSPSEKKTEEPSVNPVTASTGNSPTKKAASKPGQQTS